ncbi:MULTISPECIES: thermonuclease family protein [Rhizobium]|uniref:Thermonuclease family protein n=1 Tax=Rhizobium rhododendri TaxID=2506430 RepID=A0ABY8IN06_9HYPH|nr:MULTISPECIES: thermonuclease family protein [Rhizobium]MBZ5758278.1 thermonuclease family protein [Rhizobium sp. VS19-DR96]MBZ5764892.1 thermonuclease family protein [Rhizobium sp. VS19-DR129.2]MBZ5772435.1 thermonuclease family protein [Rhizobium sp. VS19-DRK62.2]MBZ5782878.1 thermonuclease family protein [Rhizobium sp. VS19-DR121]MBZ5800326.1 thermonuclease family protein [Rhizobium sp. VS19-DR181]
MAKPRGLWGDSLMAFAFLGLLGLLAFKLNLQPETVANGNFSVVDGDSLKREGGRFRLVGIDAPELRQQCQRDSRSWDCGQVARDALSKMLAAGPVECRGRQRDRYDRLLVTCSVGGLDVNAEMVRRGMAVGYGAYEAEEAEARDAKAGLWAGSFERPRDYRRDGGAAQSSRDPLAGIGEYVRDLMGWR